MQEPTPVRRIVEFEFPDADAAANAVEMLNLHVAKAAESAGAAVVRQEFAIDETSTADPDGALLAEFEAHVDPDTDLFNPGLQERLDTPLNSVLLGDDLDLNTESKKQRTRMLGLMHRDGVTSVRDVIIRGTDALLDIRSFGPGFIGTLRAELTAHIPELPFQGATSPIITARFCETLDQVVLVPMSEKVSIAELLGASEEEIATRLQIDGAYAKTWAQQYADEFHRAKDAQKLRGL